MLTIDHKHCTGCGACVEACPQPAVVLVRDKYTFVYPSIDSGKCAQCGRCEEVCPLNKPPLRPSAAFEARYYVAAARDREMARGGHAGGVFGALAQAVIAEGGVVYSCAFDEYYHPRHLPVDCADELPALYGMKPVQSDTSGIFRAVREDAETGVTVLFAGTPCQCDGLQRFLGKSYPNLLLLDMLCGGVTSEGIFHRYLRWMEERLKGKIRDIRFENPSAFGHSGGMKVICRREKVRLLYSFPAEWDVFFRMQREGFLNRRACGECRYASLERVGDISLGRFPDIRRAHPTFSYQNGASLVIISTAKGAGLWAQAAGSLICEPSDRERAAANPRLTAPPKEHRHRAKLLTDIFRHGFAQAAVHFGRARPLAALMALVRCAFPDRAVIALARLRQRWRDYRSEHSGQKRQETHIG